MNHEIALMKMLARVAVELGVGDHVFVVGGAVRDFLLGRPIKDVDVVLDTVAAGKNSEALALGVLGIAHLEQHGRSHDGAPLVGVILRAAVTD